MAVIRRKKEKTTATKLPEHLRSAHVEGVELQGEGHNWERSYTQEDLLSRLGDGRLSDLEAERALDELESRLGMYEARSLLNHQGQVAQSRALERWGGLDAPAIQRKSRRSALSARHQRPAQGVAALGQGMALPPAVLRHFERLFGADFSAVRIHTDAGANALAQGQAARAFTMGQHIVFDRGEYDPHSPTGLKLLTHELTHVLQQRRLNLNGPLAPPREAALEGEAERNESLGSQAMGHGAFAQTLAQGGQSHGRESRAIPGSNTPLVGSVSHGPVGESPLQAKGKKPTEDTGGKGKKEETGAGDVVEFKAEDKAKAQAEIALKVEAQKQRPPGGKPLPVAAKVVQAPAPIAKQEGEGQPPKVGVPKAPKAAPTPIASDDLIQALSRKPLELVGDYQNWPAVAEAAVLKRRQEIAQSTPAVHVRIPGRRGQKPKGQAYRPPQTAVPQLPAPRAITLGKGSDRHLQRMLEQKRAKKLAESSDSGDKEAALKAIQTQAPHIITDPGPNPIHRVVENEGTKNLSHAQGQVDDNLARGKAMAQKALRSQTSKGRFTRPTLAHKAPILKLNMPEPQAPQTPVGEMEKLKQLALPGDLQAAFNKAHHGYFQQKLKASKASVAQKRKQSETAKAQAQKQAAGAAKLKAQGIRREQDQVINQGHKKLTTYQYSAEHEQKSLQNKLKAESKAAQKGHHRAIDAKVKSDSQRIDRDYAHVKAKAQAEVKAAENKAGKKKKEAQEKAKSGNLFTALVDFFVDLFNDVVDFVKGVFKAVQQRVTRWIKAVQKRVKALIKKTSAWIRSKVQQFGKWLKDKADQLLKDRFPGIHKRFVAAVDATVNRVNKAVKSFATKLEKSVDAVAKKATETLNKVVNTLNKGLEFGRSLATAVLKGEFSKVAKLIIEGALSIFGIDKKEFWKTFGSVEQLLEKVIKNPGQFLKNLLAGVNRGFSQFSGNFLVHLKNGLVGWMTGALGNIELPKRFDAAGLFHVVTQILGIDRAHLKQRIEKRLGTKRAARLDRVYGYLETLLSKGMVGLWEQVKKDLGGLYQSVFDALGRWLSIEVIKAAVLKLATMWNPIGGLAQVLMTAWKVITFFRDQFQRMMSLVKGIAKSMGAIINGQTKVAADRIEKVLATAVPIAIDLLAKLIGVGNPGAAIRRIVGNIRVRIDRAINRFIKRVNRLSKRAAKGKNQAKGKSNTKADKRQGKGNNKEGKLAFKMGKEDHTLYFKAGKRGHLDMASKRQRLSKKVGNAVAGLIQKKAPQDQIDAVKKLGKLAKLVDTNLKKGTIPKTLVQNLQIALRDYGAKFGVEDVLPIASKVGLKDSDIRAKELGTYTHHIWMNAMNGSVVTVNRPDGTIQKVAIRGKATIGPKNTKDLEKQKIPTLNRAEMKTISGQLQIPLNKVLHQRMLSKDVSNNDFRGGAELNRFKAKFLEIGQPYLAPKYKRKISGIDSLELRHPDGREFASKDSNTTASLKAKKANKKLAQGKGGVGVTASSRGDMVAWELADMGAFTKFLVDTMKANPNKSFAECIAMVVDRKLPSHHQHAKTVQIPSSNSVKGGQKSHGVHIGVNQYDGEGITSLSGCIADAKAMKAALSGPGYQGIVVENPRVAGIRTAYQKAVNQAKAGEALYFTYSGHGTKVGGDRSVGQTDGSGGDGEVGLTGRDHPKDLYRYSQVKSLLSRASAKGLDTQMVVDACFSGQVVNNIRDAFQQAAKGGLKGQRDEILFHIAEQLKVLKAQVRGFKEQWLKSHDAVHKDAIKLNLKLKESRKGDGNKSRMLASRAKGSLYPSRKKSNAKEMAIDAKVASHYVPNAKDLIFGDQAGEVSNETEALWKSVSQRLQQVAKIYQEHTGKALKKVPAKVTNQQLDPQLKAIDEMIAAVNDAMRSALRKKGGKKAAKKVKFPASRAKSVGGGQKVGGKEEKRAFKMGKEDHTLYAKAGKNGYLDMASKRQRLSKKVGNAVAGLIQKKAPKEQIESVKKLGGRIKQIEGRLKKGLEVGDALPALSQALSAYGRQYDMDDIVPIAAQMGMKGALEYSNNPADYTHTIWLNSMNQSIITIQRPDGTREKVAARARISVEPIQKTKLREEKMKRLTQAEMKGLSEALQLPFNRFVYERGQKSEISHAWINEAGVKRELSAMMKGEVKKRTAVKFKRQMAYMEDMQLRHPDGRFLEGKESSTTETVKEKAINQKLAKGKGSIGITSSAQGNKTAGEADFMGLFTRKLIEKLKANPNRSFSDCIADIVDERIDDTQQIARRVKIPSAQKGGGTLQSYGVHIGVDHYDNISSLHGCRNDARAMKAALSGPNYTGSVIENPTVSTIRNAYLKQVQAAKPGAQLYLSYSGHGTKQGGDRQTGTTDGSAGAAETGLTGRDHPHDLYRYTEIKSMLAQASGRGLNVEMVVDSCYSGQLVNNIRDSFHSAAAKGLKGQKDEVLYHMMEQLNTLRDQVRGFKKGWLDIQAKVHKDAVKLNLELGKVKNGQSSGERGLGSRSKSPRRAGAVKRHNIVKRMGVDAQLAQHYVGSARDLIFGDDSGEVSNDTEALWKSVSQRLGEVAKIFQAHTGKALKPVPLKVTNQQLDPQLKAIDDMIAMVNQSMRTALRQSSPKKPSFPRSGAKVIGSEGK